MYPLNFLAVVIAGLSAITSTDARVAKRNPSDIEENAIKSAIRDEKGGMILDDNKPGLHIRQAGENTKWRRDSSGHSDESTLIGDLVPAILELYGSILDIAGPIVVEIPVVKDTPLVQSTFPGVIIDLGKTLDNTLHL